MHASTLYAQSERHIPTCAWVPPEPVEAAAPCSADSAHPTSARAVDEPGRLA